MRHAYLPGDECEDEDGSIAVSWSTPHRTLMVMVCMSGMTVMTMIPMSVLLLRVRPVLPVDECE